MISRSIVVKASDIRPGQIWYDRDLEEYFMILNDDKVSPGDDIHMTYQFSDGVKLLTLTASFRIRARARKWGSATARMKLIQDV